MNSTVFVSVVVDNRVGPWWHKMIIIFVKQMCVHVTHRYEKCIFDLFVSCCLLIKEKKPITLDHWSESSMCLTLMSDTSNQHGTIIINELRW